MTVLVPMSVEQDEDGWWWAHAQLGPNLGANGQGRTKPEALADLSEAVRASFEVGGVRAWLVHSDLLAVDVHEPRSRRGAWRSLGRTYFGPYLSA